MTSYTFKVSGHANITAVHKTTLEFTKDDHLSPTGDCIIGINADFNLSELKKFKGKIQITMKINDLQETITASINPKFADEKELVIRTTSFLSSRTFAIHADKPAQEISRKIIKKLTHPYALAEITINSTQ
ncbi:MAG TPA: DUF371 domain-containing protein [Candidatus Nanoarchaeia archaeon]|nr:DUF371 domain-containing protein [Candidatus Nanoarchaeia archaeon]